MSKQNGKSKQMSIAETKQHFTQILRKLREPFTVTRHGQPVAIILSLANYQTLLRQSAYREIMQLRQSLSDGTLSASEAYRISRRQLEQRTDSNRR